MRIIENRTFPSERALYGENEIVLKNCRFEGEEDGESALKEARSVRLENCYMDLRYPLWHVTGAEMTGCETTANCRAALWYDDGVKISARI